MKDLYSLAINGMVYAENMTLQFATRVIAGLVETDPDFRTVDEVTIQRVREGEE